MRLATDSSLRARPLCSVLLALGLTGHDFGRRVNHELAPGQDANHWVPSSDGDTLFYSVTEDEFAGGQLFRVPIDGSQDALALTDPLPVDRDLYGVLISSDESRLVYTADQDTDEQWEIYSVPTDGSKAVVKLNLPLTPTQDVYPGYFRFTPDGTRVVFRVGLGGGFIYSAPVDGSAPAVQLTPTFTGGLFQVTAEYVVFDAGEMFSVAVDGSAAPVQLSGTAVGEQPWDFYVSPDGQRVVYMGVTYVPDPDPKVTAIVYWIFSSPVDGGSEPVLLFNPVRWSEILGTPEPMIRISPDSRWVLQRSDSSTGRKLYSAPIDGSAPAVRLSDAGAWVGYDFRITPGGHVVFGSQDVGVPYGIYVAPVDGSASAQRITELTTYPVPLKWEVASGRVAFVGYAPDPITSELRYEVYSVPIAGNAPPVKLNPPMVPGGDVVSGNTLNAPSMRVSDDGEWVVYVADQDTDEVDELYAVPSDGRLHARKLNRPLPTGSYISEYLFRVMPSSKRVIYGAQQDAIGQWGFFTTELGSPLPYLGESSSVPAGLPIR